MDDRECLARLRRQSRLLLRDVVASPPGGIRELAYRFARAMREPENEVQDALLRFTLADVLLGLEQIVRRDAAVPGRGDWFGKLARADAAQLGAIFIEAAGIVAGQAGSHGNGQRDLADRAMRLLDQDVASWRTVGELARRLNCHPRRLQEVFRRKHGMTVHRYVDVVRAAECVRLIRCEGLKVEAAALAVGLKSRTTLYKLLLRTTGRALHQLRSESPGPRVEALSPACTEQ